MSRIYDIINERHKYDSIPSEVSDESMEDWLYNLGDGMKNVSEKSNIPENRNVIAYVNDIPVYEDEIIDRIEKNNAISDAMEKSAGNSTPPLWYSDSFGYVYIEKFMISYARENDIDVSKEELEEQILYERNAWESEKETFEQYLSGRGITEEEFFNDIAPPSYIKTILKNKVRNHIIKNSGITEMSNKEQQEYLDEFFNEKIKVVEIDKDFIKNHR